MSLDSLPRSGAVEIRRAGLAGHPISRHGETREAIDTRKREWRGEFGLRRREKRREGSGNATTHQCVSGHSQNLKLSLLRMDEEVEENEKWKRLQVYGNWRCRQNLNLDCNWLRRLTWDMLSGHVGFVNPIAWLCGISGTCVVEVDEWQLQKSGVLFSRERKWNF